MYDSIELRTFTVGIPTATLKANNFYLDLTRLMNTYQKVSKQRKVSSKTFRIVLSPTAGNAIPSHEELKVLIEYTRSFEIRWICVPIILRSRLEQSRAYEILRDFPNCFVNIIKESSSYNIDYLSAELIQKTSLLGSCGEENFRLGFSLGVAPHTPFFPAAYHEGEHISFSVGLETLPFFMSRVVDFILYERDNNLPPIFNPNINILNKSLVEVGASLISNLEETFLEISSASSICYKGMDISLSPIPSQNQSVAKLVEYLSGYRFGSGGGLQAPAVKYLKCVLGQIIEYSRIKSVGFNGVMLSPLEDVGLLAPEKDFDLDYQYIIPELNALSNFCGVGLDMIPLDGQVDISDLVHLIRNLEVNSNEGGVYGRAFFKGKNKPLTIRLLPIPGKRAYETVELLGLNQDFFTPTLIAPILNKISTDYKDLEWQLPCPETEQGS